MKTTEERLQELIAEKSYNMKLAILLLWEHQIRHDQMKKDWEDTKMTIDKVFDKK